MAGLKLEFARGTLVIALVLVAGTAFGLARSIWDANLFPARQAALSSSCQNNLKQMGLVFKIFANDHKGEIYPVLSSEPGNLMFHWTPTYPTYMDNRKLLVCPGPADEVPENTFTDKYYVYTGYMITNDADLDAFATAYTAELADDADFSVDLPADTSYPGDKLYRLREGIERFQITDINDPGASAGAKSKLPVLWEWPDNHQQGFGGNVLFMDGHVEWIAYPGKFPMTEHAVETMAALANYTPPADWHGKTIESDYVGLSTYPSSCANNLKQIGLVNKMYANEAAGEAYPPLSSTGGKLMLDADSVYPEYASDPDIFLCPGREISDPEPFIDDAHYAYLGFVLMNDSDVQQFATAYNQVISSGGDFNEDLAVASSYGDSILRIREGVGRFVNGEITEPTQDVPGRNIVAMIEWPENHERNSGGHVLYMDGRVEWMPYPGEFPMTEQTIATLRALAENTPATTWPEVDRGPEDQYGYIRACSNKLRAWGLVNWMYRHESAGQYFPPLSSAPGQLFYREASVVPEYFLDLDISACPGALWPLPVEALDDQHYVYLGYMLLNEADVQAFAGAYASSAMAPENDLAVSSSYGDKILRLRERVNLEPVADINQPPKVLALEKDVPVLIEWPGNHEGLTGGHVLYMDGHTDWHDYPGEFPMTENVINALDSIANWTPTTAWAVPRFPGVQDAYNNGICRGNVQFFGLSMKIYSNRSNGEVLPPLSSEPGLLMMDDDRFFRYQLGDIRRMNCPGSEMAYRQAEVHDDCYAYLGYAIPDQSTLERFATAYAQQTASGGDFSEDLGDEVEPIYRLREGVEHLLFEGLNSSLNATYIQSKIPVLVEWPDNHPGVRGGNVLFMDGHAEWVDYPGKFPMSEEAMNILTGLAGRGPIRALEPAAEGPSRLQHLLNLGGASSRR